MHFKSSYEVFRAQLDRFGHTKDLCKFNSPKSPHPRCRAQEFSYVDFNLTICLRWVPGFAIGGGMIGMVEEEGSLSPAGCHWRIFGWKLRNDTMFTVIHMQTEKATNLSMSTLSTSKNPLLRWAMGLTNWLVTGNISLYIPMVIHLLTS